MSLQGQQTPPVRRLESREEAVSLLEMDRLYAAVPLTELERGSFERTGWIVVEDGSESTLCQHTMRGWPRQMFLMGSENGVAILLGSTLRSAHISFTCEQRHMTVIQALYQIDGLESLVRMATTSERFRPVQGDVIPLASEDLDDIRVLFRLGGLGPVSMGHLSTGVYWGARCEGRLVAVAGTHAISQTYGIAAVANVFTHPQYRNMGYATSCTSAVTAQLLRTCRDVVLNVASENGPAMRAYTKLGFREHCRFVEATGLRKGADHLGGTIGPARA